MRDLRLFWRDRHLRRDKGVFRLGRHGVPFTQERRCYLCVGPVGFEFWTGPRGKKPDIFVD